MTSQPFSPLNPDTVLSCVEQATGRKLLNVCRPHSSYINRVFELQDENGEYLIAKFFRPHRWSEEALLDELRYVRDCDEEELPVIAPLPLADGSYLARCGDIHFAVYPRCGGRLVDEYSEEQWLELGRLIGRLHGIGRLRDAPARNRIHPQHTTREQAEYILSSGLLPEDLKETFVRVVEELIAEIEPRFSQVDYLRIHGDCHSGNLIYRPGQSFFIIDFDDMAVGPPVQDIWMLLPGVIGDSALEVELFLEGYETFSTFDRSSVQLVEPLRAMRFIHYISWCGKQYLEDGVTRVNDDFGSYSYWRQEIDDLQDQLKTIRGERD